MIAEAHDHANVVMDILFEGHDIGLLSTVPDLDARYGVEWGWDDRQDLFNIAADRFQEHWQENATLPGLRRADYMESIEEYGQAIKKAIYAELSAGREPTLDCIPTQINLKR